MEAVLKDLSQFMLQHLDYCKMLHDAQRDEKKRRLKVEAHLKEAIQSRHKYEDDLEHIREITKCPNDDFFETYYSYLSGYEESKRKVARLEHEASNVKLICAERVRFARHLVRRQPNSASIDTVMNYMVDRMDDMRSGDKVWLPVSSSEYRLASIVSMCYDKYDVQQGTATVRFINNKKDGEEQGGDMVIQWHVHRLWESFLPCLDNGSETECLALRAICLPDITDFVV